MRTRLSDRLGITRSLTPSLRAVGEEEEEEARDLSDEEEGVSLRCEEGLVSRSEGDVADVLDLCAFKSHSRSLYLIA